MDAEVVIGLDPHKDVLVAVAVDGNGRQLDVKDSTARPRGYRALLAWARKLGNHRWAVEDVRHVAGGLVRFLLAEDEDVVWVPTHMSSDYRRRVRAVGKSDPIDALACARAALAEDLPVAVPETDVREIKMLLDHREDLVGEMVRMCCRLRWHLHDIDPDFADTIPARKLHRPKWNALVTEFLHEREGSVATSICLDLIERIKDLGECARRLEHKLEERVKVEAPQLLELPGRGPMSAARIVAETGDPRRFKSAAAFAMFTGCAPIPASSGNSQRVRLNRGGNRRMNAAIHRIAITQKRMHPPAQEYLAARRALGNSNTEAIRALKRHIARRVFALLRQSEPGTARLMGSPAIAQLAA